MNTLLFDDWLKTYLEFRSEAAKLLSQRVPNVRSALDDEAQRLEPLYWQAEDMRADGASYYYKAKTEKIKELDDAGYAVSALSELAKAACYKTRWAMDNSDGVCNAIKSRQIKIAQFLKLQAH